MKCMPTVFKYITRKVRVVMSGGWRAPPTLPLWELVSGTGWYRCIGKNAVPDHREPVFLPVPVPSV